MTVSLPSSKLPVAPQKAVSAFLKEMSKVAKRTFPAWQNTLTAGLDDCPLTFDQRRAVFEVHALDDYYFAAVVALGASRLRALFSTEEADELFAVLGDQVDAAAGRKDRIVSDLLFQIVARIERMVTPESQKTPHDQAVRVILEHLGINQLETTRHLMTHTLYRHTLGEPLALGVPQWWSGFVNKYALAPSEQPATSSSNLKLPKPPTRRRSPRGVVAFP